MKNNKENQPTPDRKIIMFLRPIHACIIKRIIEAYIDETEEAEKQGDLRQTDLVARGASADFGRQLTKQFTDADLDDVMQDMAIMEALNNN